MTTSMTLPPSAENSGSFLNNVPTAVPDDKTAQKLVAWAKDNYGSMKSSRSKVQRQWYYNLSMYYGQQYYSLVNLANGNRLLQVPRAPKGVVRHTVNLIRPMIRSEIARMTSQKPSATAVPATTSDNDMFAAQAAEQVWEFLQQRRKFHQKMMRNAFWTSITGTGFMKTWWDPGLDKNTALLRDTREPAVGDVMLDVTTPFNLFVPDLLEQEIENQPYIIEAYTKTVSWVKKFLPQAKNVVPDVVSRNEIIETAYFDLPGGNQAAPDAVLVMECWVKPGGSDILPNGGQFIVVGNTIASMNEGMPYTHGEYPYTKFEHVPTGKFYGDSVLIDVNHLQREYNRTRSHIIESKALMGRPQLLVAEGSMDETKWTAQPGLIIKYKQGFTPPQALPLASLPAYILQEQDRIKADIEDITAQHSVTRGQAPGAGVTAATAISFLQERDDSIMGPTYASIEAGTEKIARQALSLVVDYYDLPRIIEFTGLDQSFDSLELKGSDIANGINIRVEGGSALPTSKAARQALLMDLTKMGAISPDQMLDMLDIGGIGKLTERLRVDMRQAQRENLRIKRLTEQDIGAYEQQMSQAARNGDPSTIDPNTGLPTVLFDTPATFPPIVPVNDFDNHQVHIATHNNYRKSQEYENLPPAVKDQFDRHVRMHQNAMLTGVMGQGGIMPPTPAGGNDQQAPGAPPGAPQGDQNAQQGSSPDQGTMNFNMPPGNSQGGVPNDQSQQG